MRKQLAILFLFLCAINRSAFAGGPECAKVIIDGYGQYGGEAAAIYEGEWSPVLTQEATATTYVAKAFCDAYMHLYEAIQYDEDAQRDGIALAYLECDWAKEMRAWRDEYNAGGTVSPELAKRRAMKLRAWNDRLTKWMQKTSEKYIGEYVPKK